LWKELKSIKPWEAQLNISEAEEVYLRESWAYRKRKRRLLILFWLIFGILSLLLIWAFWPKAQAEKEASFELEQMLDQISCFGEDCLILVVRKDPKGALRYGFIDKKGRQRIPYQYTEADPFDEYGYARVKIGDRLYLIDTNNRRLPLAESIKALTDSTKALSLNEQLLDSLPQEIFNSTQLEVLYLRGNQLEEIPKEIANLPLLKVLDLGYNEIQQLPLEIAELPLLEILDLQNNKLTQFPMPLTEMEDLEELDLSENLIPAIPKEIAKMKALKKLNLANNKLTEIDSSVIHLENLEELNVYGNEITFVPNAVLKMDLKVLNVGGNRLSKQEEKKVFKYAYSEENEVAKDPERRKAIKNSENYSKTRFEEELENLTAEDDAELENNCNRFWENEKANLSNLNSKMFPLNRTETYRYQMSLHFAPEHRLLSSRFYLKMMFSEELLPNQKTNFYLFGHNKKKLPCKAGKIDISKDGETYTVILYPELLPNDTTESIQNPIDWLAKEELYSVEVEYEISEGVKKSFNRAIRPASGQLIQQVIACMLSTTGQEARLKLAKCSDYFRRRVDSLNVRLMETIPLKLVQNSKFVFRINFEQKGENAWMYVQTNFDQILDKDDRIVFEFQDASRKVFAFEQKHELILLNAKYGSRNRIRLSRKDLEHFAETRIFDVKIMKNESRRVYPFSISPQYSQEIRKVLKCYIEDLDSEY
jgi:hypothetical protein